jgi:DNA ligase-1
MKQEYLMLAQTYKPMKHYIAGWLLSEKMDGERAFWDGGVSRGIPASEIPYANTVKDHRLKVQPVATGLWSRTGKVIHALDSWLDQLPRVPLDCELFMGRKQFQTLRKIVAQHVPDERWNQVTLNVFDSPPMHKFLECREIKVRSQYSYWVEPSAEKWYWEHAAKNVFNYIVVHQKGFSRSWLCSNIKQNKVVVLIPQIKLSNDLTIAKAEVASHLDAFLMNDAEGVMLRDPKTEWDTIRSHSMLKHKPWFDAEGVITGFTSGRETERGSKLRGLIGALVLDFNGKRLELSGLTDEERTFDANHRDWAWHHPGEEMPEFTEGKHFKVGQLITFKYRELSDDGVPKEARYWRKR